MYDWEIVSLCVHCVHGGNKNFQHSFILIEQVRRCSLVMYVNDETQGLGGFRSTDITMMSGMRQPELSFILTSIIIIIVQSVIDFAAY